MSFNHIQSYKHQSMAQANKRLIMTNFNSLIDFNYVEQAQSHLNIRNGVIPQISMK